jgi:uncharacterized membrane protein YfcA
MKKMDTNTVLILLGIGIGAGFISGLVGVGGGVIIVPALVLFLGLTQQQAQGTSTALFLIPLSFALAAWNYHKSGNIEWPYVFVMLITFMAGSYFGSKVAISIDQGVVKKIFGGFLFLIALKLIIGK